MKFKAYPVSLHSCRLPIVFCLFFAVFPLTKRGGRLYISINRRERGVLPKELSQRAADGGKAVRVFGTNGLSRANRTGACRSRGDGDPSVTKGNRMMVRLSGRKSVKPGGTAGNEFIPCPSKVSMGQGFLYAEIAQGSCPGPSQLPAQPEKKKGEPHEHRKDDPLQNLPGRK